MAEEVGSAFVSLIPSARGFSRIARRQLRTALTGVSGDVPLHPGVNRGEAARAGRQASRTAQAAAPAVELPVDIDRASLRRALSGLAGLGSRGRGLRLNVGTPAGLAAIAAAASGASAALAGLASAGAALIPILGQMVAVAFTAAGALAAIPGALAVASAAVGTLVIGSLGLGEALKTAGQAADEGGLAAARLGRRVQRAARQVELAERRVTDAQRAARQAQEDLNRARADARENLEDLALSLARARLDEEAAVLAVAEAQQELAAARADPESTVLDIRRADLAYRQSVQTLAEVREHLGDVSAEQAEASRRGVEGSEQVQTALQAQSDAHLAVEDATHDLRAAQQDLALAQQQTTTATGNAQTAMAKLSPAAQALVRTLLGLRATWDQLRMAIQERLFTGVAAAIQRLATVSLPTLRTGLVGIAAAINGVLLGALAQLSTQAAQLQLASIFDSTRRSVDGLSEAVRPLLQALLDVAAVGADVVADLTGPLGQLLTDFSARLSEMAASGALRQLILDGLDALATLGRALLDIGGIIRGVFEAAGAAGGGGIFGFLERLNDLVNSLAGQRALGQFFAELGRIGTALQPVLLALGRGLGVVAGAIGDIAVQTAPFLTQFLGLLADALASLAPGFIALGPAVVALGQALLPLATILADLVVGLAPGVATFLTALGDGLRLLAPAAGLVGQALTQVLEAVAPLLPLLGAALANALSVVATILAGLVNGPGAAFIEVLARIFTQLQSALTPVFTQLAQSLLPVFAQAGERIVAAFEPLIPVIGQVATLFATRLAAALPGLVTAFGDLVLAFADMAGPIGQALLDLLIGLVPELPKLVDAGLALALALTDVLTALVPLLPDLTELLTLVLGLVTPSVLAALITLLRLSASSLQAMASGAAAIVGPFRRGAEAVGRFRSSVSDRFRSVVRLVRGLPGRILRAIGNIGGLLWRAGRDLIGGLVDGIRAMLPNLRAWLSHVTDLIPSWKGPLDDDRRLLRPAGRAIMQGLNTGILDELPAVERTLRGVTGDIAGHMPAGSAAAAGATVTIDATGLPRALATWLRGAVRTQGGGSVQRFAGQGAGA